MIVAVLIMALIIHIPVSSVHAQDTTYFGSYTDDARAARISELKTKYKINLTSEERERIISRCDIVHGSIDKLSTKVVSSTSKRLDTYETVITTLTSLRVGLATRQVDASNLELLIVDYQNSLKDFSIASTSYQTAIDDALAIDCRQDPENFKASIEGIREGRKKSADVANEIDELTQSSLKTVFDTISSKLEVSNKAVSNGN